MISFGATAFRANPVHSIPLHVILLKLNQPCPVHDIQFNFILGWATAFYADPIHFNTIHFIYFCVRIRSGPIHDIRVIFIESVPPHFMQIQFLPPQNISFCLGRIRTDPINDIRAIFNVFVATAFHADPANSIPLHLAFQGSNPPPSTP